MKYRIAAGLCCAVTALVLAGCATKTTVASRWMSDSYSSGPVKRVLVVGIAPSNLSRRTWEDRFSTALSDHDVEAVSSYTLLPSDHRLAREDLERAIAEQGFDAVIASRLLGKYDETTYVPPTTSVVPTTSVRRGYGGYYGYYGHHYDVVNRPGYTISKKVVRLETRLFNSGDGELVWGMESETFDAESTEDAIQSVTRRITDQLSADGLVAR